MKDYGIPACPNCNASDLVMPARCLSRPESAGGRAVGCAACGGGVPATREQVAAVERRERVWREAESRKKADEGRGIQKRLSVYVEQVEAEDERAAAPRAEQVEMFPAAKGA